MRAYTQRDTNFSPSVFVVVVEHDGVFYTINNHGMRKLQDDLQKLWAGDAHKIDDGSLLDTSWVLL